MKTTLQTLAIMVGLILLLVGIIEVIDHYPMTFVIVAGGGSAILISIMMFVCIKTILDARERDRKKRISPMTGINHSSLP